MEDHTVLTTLILRGGIFRVVSEILWGQGFWGKRRVVVVRSYALLCSWCSCQVFLSVNISRFKNKNTPRARAGIKELSVYG